jgi:hypothetical protein
MDQEKLTLFARVKLVSRKAGFDLDLARMMSDDGYARQELERFSSSGVDELVAVAKQAMQKLAAPVMPAPTLEVSAPTVEPTTAVETAAPESPAPELLAPEAKKYVLGVRG